MRVGWYGCEGLEGSDRQSELRHRRELADQWGGLRIQSNPSASVTLIEAGPNEHANPLMIEPMGTFLLLSGIEPAAELSKHGIEQLVNAPEVGRNFHDHVCMSQFYQVCTPNVTSICSSVSS